MQNISLANLAFMLIPLCFVWYFYAKWTNKTYEIPYATLRMLLQLVLIGYVLVLVFENKNIFLGMIILSFMLIASCAIMFRNTKDKSLKNFALMLFVTCFSASIHLFLMIHIVLDISYFYEPRYVIPIAGMIFSNIMNVISLAIERFEEEVLNNSFEIARNTAFKASLIPQINSLLAVGIVALPGMMTGQILSGIDPLIAVRYQIMIAILGVSGGGVGVILYFLIKKKFQAR